MIAFKETSKMYPNYGKKTDMGARQWWTEVINKTFTPHHTGSLPTNLTSTLINRFWCKDGYTLFPDVSYLQQLSQTPQRQRNAEQRLVIGVITNSDDRVPDVLSSLGLRVNGLRYNGSPERMAEESRKGEEQEAQDVDFCIMSYDVGVEKPQPEIFKAAITTLDSLLHSEGNSYESKDWDLLYVGDEVAKDAKGAVQAGWDAVLVDRGTEVDAAYEGDAPGVEGLIDVEGKKVPVLKGFEALGTYGGHELLKIR
ncbi:hypothetical protein E4T52_09537 [Aureobasidium sp. EXF-3400]|nr:hypothetical protein E4T51_08684 [Aureobasidium sp. EXF-12344]KAI4775504.1 hypothetical protein E4T52_09537 [Aureobasidium sp. EXF-3400]